MQFNKVHLDREIAVGQSFEFPTMEISTADYGSFYNQVCKGLDPIKSFGIYEVTDEVTKFTVAIETKTVNAYQSYEIPAGTYYEFEIDLFANMKDNQYVKCFAALENAGVEYNQAYSFEVMDRNFNPETGQTKFKFYISAN